MMIQQDRIRYGDQRMVVTPAQLAEALRIRLQGPPYQRAIVEVFHPPNLILNRAALHFCR